MRELKLVHEHPFYQLFITEVDIDRNGQSQYLTNVTLIFKDKHFKNFYRRLNKRYGLHFSMRIDHYEDGPFIFLGLTSIPKNADVVSLITSIEAVDNTTELRLIESGTVSLDYFEVNSNVFSGTRRNYFFDMNEERKIFSTRITELLMQLLEQQERLYLKEIKKGVEFV